MSASVIKDKVLLKIDNLSDDWIVYTLTERTFEALINLTEKRFEKDLINKVIKYFTYADGELQIRIECNADLFEAFGDLADGHKLKLKIVTKEIDNTAATQQGIFLIWSYYDIQIVSLMSFWYM